MFVLGRFINLSWKPSPCFASPIFLESLMYSSWGPLTPQEGFLQALTTNLMKMNPNKHVKTTPSGYCEVSTPPKKKSPEKGLEWKFNLPTFPTINFQGIYMELHSQWFRKKTLAILGVMTLVENNPPKSTEFQMFVSKCVEWPWFTYKGSMRSTYPPGNQHIPPCKKGKSSSRVTAGRGYVDICWIC